MKHDNVKHKYVTQDDVPCQIKVLVIPINDDWGRIIFSCNIGGKVYRLGSLAPRAKDIDSLVAGARLAGWKIDDKRS